MSNLVHHNDMKVERFVDRFDLMIDTCEETIYDMGLYPVIASMFDALQIGHSIVQATREPDTRSKLPFGVLTKAFVLNILNRRTPLVHMAHSFSKVDCGVLFGEGITNEDFTEERLGTALDAISEINQREVSSHIALNALHLHGIPVNSVHVDGTNITFEGSYEGEAPAEFQITYGKPKNKRTDLKQANVGAAVQQNGLPLFMQALSGNSHDGQWFRDAMSQIAGFSEQSMDTNPILICDAAGSNEQMFDQSYAQKIPCILRLSERFSIAKTCIDQAWMEHRWEKIGVLAQHDTNETAEYRITPFEAPLGQHSWRILVVHSSALQAAKEATVARKLPKEKIELKKRAAKVEKKAYATAEEAYAAAEHFCSGCDGEWSSLFDVSPSFQIEVIEKCLKRGRSGPNNPKVPVTSYRPHILLGEVNSEKYLQWLQRQSCFVLANSVPKTRYTDEQILMDYNGQWKIEDQFRFLKQPMILGPMWLHNPHRIKALLFLLWISVLVAAYLRHRLTVSLKGNPPVQEQATSDEVNLSTSMVITDTSTEESKIKPSQAKRKCMPSTPFATLTQIPEVPTRVSGASMPSTISKNHVHRINASSYRPRRILTVDGRLVERPTFKVIFELFASLKTKAYFDGEHWVRKYTSQTQRYLLQLIQNLGFDPAIYIEPFHPSLDLWKYKMNHH